MTSKRRNQTTDIKNEVCAFGFAFNYLDPSLATDVVMTCHCGTYLFNTFLQSPSFTMH